MSQLSTFSYAEASLLLDQAVYLKKPSKRP
jgi:hypothetical protein